MIDFSIGLKPDKLAKAKEFYIKLCTSSFYSVTDITEDEQYKKINEGDIEFEQGGTPETFLLSYIGIDGPLICTFRTNFHHIDGHIKNQSFAIIKNNNVLITNYSYNKFYLYDKIKNYLFDDDSSMRKRKRDEISNIIDNLMSKLK